MAAGATWKESLVLPLATSTTQQRASQGVQQTTSSAEITKAQLQVWLGRRWEPVWEAGIRVTPRICAQEPSAPEGTRPRPSAAELQVRPSRIPHEHRNKAWLHLQQPVTSRPNLIQPRPTLCDNRASVPQTSVHVHNFKHMTITPLRLNGLFDVRSI